MAIKRGLSAMDRQSRRCARCADLRRAPAGGAGLGGRCRRAGYARRFGLTAIIAPITTITIPASTTYMAHPSSAWIVA